MEVYRSVEYTISISTDVGRVFDPELVDKATNLFSEEERKTLKIGLGGHCLSFKSTVDLSSITQEDWEEMFYPLTISEG